MTTDQMKIPLPQNFDPPKPLQIYDYHDLTINLFASSVQPHRFSLRQLQKKQIIPSDWELKLPVRKKTGLLYFSFLQGLNISIYQGKIVFAQKIIKKNINLATIIHKFINYFNKYNYNRVQIILNRLITLPNNINTTNKFIQNSLLNGSEWEILGNKPVRKQVNYYYPNLSCPMMLNVIDFPLKNKKLKSNSCLVFRGIFDYKISNKLSNNNYTEMMSIIENYQDNINVFNKIIDRDILND